MIVNEFGMKVQGGDIPSNEKIGMGFLWMISVWQHLDDMNVKVKVRNYPHNRASTCIGTEL